jgi:hypothetical protein
MILFHRHLYLFDDFSKIKQYDVLNFSREKEIQEKDIALLILENGLNKVIYRFVIADTDINAVYSCLEDESLKEYKLKYILRKNEINQYLSGEKSYCLLNDYKEDIKKIYKEILNKNLNNLHDFYINMRLVDAKYELNDKERYSYMKEYDKYIKKIKRIIDNQGKTVLERDEEIVLCEDCLRQIGKEYYFYVTNPIEKFNVEESYDYINEVTLNRLEDKQKEEIKKYYEYIQDIYDYHLNNIGEKIDEAGELIKSFRGY